MKEQDSLKFFCFLEGCGLIYGKEIKEVQAKIFFNALSGYEFAEVEKSFNTHIRESKYFPTPADIIGNISRPILFSHVGSDEAWQVSLNSMDERATVIVNEEILKAREIAMDIYYSGDKVGARMAFREAYNRLIKQNEKPNWFVSYGHDRAGREHVKEKFEEMKQIASGYQDRLESLHVNVARIGQI